GRTGRRLPDGPRRNGRRAKSPTHLPAPRQRRNGPGPRRAGSARWARGVAPLRRARRPNPWPASARLAGRTGHCPRRAVSGRHSGRALITGNTSDPRPRDLARTILAAMGPATMVRWKADADVTATVCVRDRCLPPNKVPRELLQALVHAGMAPGGILDLPITG